MTIETQTALFGWDAIPEDDTKKKEAVKKVQKKKKEASPMTKEELQAKWLEIIRNPKNSKPDQIRLEETYHAWKDGIIFPERPKLSKAEALRMYARFNEMRKADILEKMVEETPENYHLITTEKEMDQVCEWWDTETIIAIDTETDGLDVVHGETKMVGLSITFPNVDQHVYVPVRHDVGTQLSPAYVIQRLKPYIEDENKLKVLHNAKFDAHVFSMEGAKLHGIEMDTMTGMWCLNENEPNYRLKDIANRYAKHLGVTAENDTFDELFGKNSPFNTVELKYALPYACKDTALTFYLYEFIKKQFDRPGLEGVRDIYYNVEKPLLDVVIEMEEAGFLLNTEKVESIAKELHKDVDAMAVQLLEHFGDINFSSPAQLSEVLYDKLKLPDVSKKRSTNKATLQTLSVEDEMVGMLLEHRAQTKMLSSFIDKLPILMKGTGRVYGQFDQRGTKTGRFSSKEPNLQQLPPKARTIFRAPKGKVMIGSDFSQIEPRYLSHITGDNELRKPYIEGYDLYSTLASGVFDVPIELCGDGTKYRKMMKTGLLAVMYGTSTYTLAKQLGITQEEANTFIEDFYEAYPVVGAWLGSVHEDAKKNEFVETAYGRKRRFPGHRQEAELYDELVKKICAYTGEKKAPTNVWEHQEIPYKLKRSFQSIKGKVERVRRQSVNAIIQGSSADIMKLAMIRLFRLAEKYRDEGWVVLATIHDEALLEVPEDISREQTNEIEEAMTGSATLDVPMKVDIAFMREWGNEIDRDDWFEMMGAK